MICICNVANDTWNHSPMCVPFCYKLLDGACGFDIKGNISNKMFMLHQNMELHAVGHNTFMINVGGMCNQNCFWVQLNYLMVQLGNGLFTKTYQDCRAD